MYFYIYICVYVSVQFMCGCICVRAVVSLCVCMCVCTLKWHCVYTSIMFVHTQGLNSNRSEAGAHSSIVGILR